jgi:hypothetical protein
MTTDERLEGLAKLGNYVDAIDEAELEELLLKVKNENPWFTPGSVHLALQGIRRYLNAEKLQQWSAGYNTSPSSVKTVAVVMAGNIPLAGFHDVISVLASGHVLMAKLSSKDSVLPTYLLDKLRSIEPGFQSLIKLPPQLKNFDAVIATGSDNSARYFNYYFGKYPHIIRKNRTSCAILSGEESNEDLMLLGRDVFTYFGLGCRNVSKIFIPEGFDPVRLVKAWDIYVDILHHHKYHNNYDYQKSILLVNKIPFYDSGFVILQENEKLVSPISVVYLERYRSSEDLEQKLEAISEKIQCIVGKTNVNGIAFGEAQSPELWDYADGVDTMKFLETLR